MINKKGPIYIFITGLVMGIAEVIPGVSGGTVAFVGGIYQRLLESVGNLRWIPALLAKGKWKEALQKLDFVFLVQLLGGMVLGIAIGVGLVTRFLETHPPVVWSLFFGLIVASAVYMTNKIRWEGFLPVVLLVAGMILAFGVGLLPISHGSTSLLFVFFSGMIAIIALVLPGVSGSFLLLMLGMYTFIIRDTLKGLAVNFSMDKVMVLIVFGLGCLVGLLSIARVLRWAFQRYQSPTIALLTGFMIGALPQIWPWRNTVSWLDKTTGLVTHQMPKGEYKVLEESIVFPHEYIGDPFLTPSIIAFLMGMFLVWGFWQLERKNGNISSTFEQEQTEPPIKSEGEADHN